MSAMDSIKTTAKSALNSAITAAGGISAFAKSLNLSSHAVAQQWRLNQVPANHCPDIEALTGVRCEELRPDVNWAVLRNSDKAAA